MPKNWRPVFTVAGLLTLLTFLLALSQPSDLMLRHRVHTALQSFQLHHAELSRDVLLARSGLLSNYDSLVRAAANLRQDLMEIATVSQSVTDPQTRLAFQEQIAVLKEETLRKLALLEYFKSDNALLRNSLMYLTASQTSLRSRFRKQPMVAEALDHLSNSLMSFLQTPDVPSGKQIELGLDRLSKLAIADAELRLLVTHGRMVVTMLPQADQLLSGIVAVDPSGQTGGLQEAALNYADRVEASAQRFRILLYLVAVALLVYLCWQFLRLRRTARKLATANAGLEMEMAERQQAVAALRTSEEHLRAITESAKEAIVTFDQAGDIVTWNAGATTIFEHPKEDIIGTPFLRLLKPRGDADHSVSALDRLTAPETAFNGTLELTGARANGQEFPLEASLSRWASHDQNYTTCIMRDITERKRLEEVTQQQQIQLIQADKMATLGTLVSGVAHEINNPNQLVLLNSRTLAEVWDDVIGIVDAYHDDNGAFTLAGLPYAEFRDSIPVLVRDIHGGAQRIERIVSDLKDFARPQESALAVEFNLNDVVERGLRLLAHLIDKRTARLERHLAEHLPRLRGNPQQIEQIVVNLIVNALEALPNRDATVAIATYPVRNAGWVALDVKDAGSGIAPEHLARLCDPFFTTKQASGGTGLGLAITASLVRTHGGELTFTSELGRGTQVLVQFPAVVEGSLPAATGESTHSEVLTS